MSVPGPVRGWLVGALAAVTVLIGGVPAYAADGIEIDNVTTKGDSVSVLVALDQLPDGVTADPSTVTARLSGEALEAEGKALEAGEVERITVLTIDASLSMRGERITAAKAAAKAFLAEAPADVKVGLVAFAGDVVATALPTTDHERVAGVVDDLTLSKRTKVYDAMVQAINLAGDDGARSLLVLSDGADTRSTASLDDVVGAATEAGVVVDVVSLGQSERHEKALSELASASSGSVIPADPQALSGVFTARADALASQMLVTFDAPAGVEEGTLRVTVDAGGQTYSDAAFVSFGSAVTRPYDVTPKSELVGPWALMVGAAALALGLLGVLWVVLSKANGPSATERRMSAYFGAAAGAVTHGDDPSRSSVRDSAVSMAENVLGGEIEDRINQRLEGAGSKLTAAEWLLLHAAIAVGSAFVGFLTNGPLLAVVLLLVGAVLPWVYLGFRHSRRLSAFNAQLADTLDLMAGGLQAGLSLPQAVDTVIREGHEPMAGELRRALVEQRLGVDITEALEGVAARMDSEDFRWVVMAIRIQREVGGNLAEILQTVGGTLREREYLRRQVKALSAEGRLSGYILAGLPPMIFVYMLFANRDYVRPLYTTGLGFAMLGAALCLLTLGGWAMKKLATVEA